MKSLIAIAAAGLVAASATHAAETAPAPQMMKAHHGPHIVMVKSSADFDATLAQLQSAIDARGFKTFAVIDHAAGAATVGQDLRPTTLIIFGNPKGGTPLMLADQRMGLELPLKMLVATDDQGETYLIYEDMAHLFHEYGIDGLPDNLAKIEGALAAIAVQAGAQ